MVGFHCDEEGDWVAHLDCGHRQHVRHRPPFQLRPWVLDQAARASRLGGLLECPLCDRGEPPADPLVPTEVWSDEGGRGEAGRGDVGPQEGGEAACYAHLLCEECGVVLEPGAPHRDGCSAVGGS